MIFLKNLFSKDNAYDEAEKRIEENWRIREKKLDLNYMELTELPVSIGKCTHLEELNLSHNKLTALPKSLGKLDQLKKLLLYQNQFTTLPEFLGNLKNLETLEVGNNSLANFPSTLGKLDQLKFFFLNNNQFTTLPESLGDLKNLVTLDLGFNLLANFPSALRRLKRLKNLQIYRNQIQHIPDWIGELQSLTHLSFPGNLVTELPDSLGKLLNLRNLIIGTSVGGNPVGKLPTSIGELKLLDVIYAHACGLKDLPSNLAQLKNLKLIELADNPLNPELAEAYKQGIEGVKAYLRAQAEAQIVLNEAKLVLVGEGEVGKTCLMDALLGKPWREHSSTHGIEIQSFKVNDLTPPRKLTLNGWDFGGQHVYRPTHQLFFSTPAVYLVVWKPREGPEQGFVKEWIQLVKRRAPSAKFIIVATHGGPGQRQPDIDRQELWDLFSKDTVIDFFFVDSKPDEHGRRKGIEELKQAIARVAAQLPEVGRSVPKSFADVRDALQKIGQAYLSLEQLLAICREHNMDHEIASLFVAIEHRLGHLTHYQNDPTLRDMVILRPDWLATAMSYVLEDEETRNNHGLVDFSRLSHLWNDPARPADTRYSNSLHRIFLRLMERFDLSYRVADLSKDEDTNPVSLIAQLVPDNTPKEDDFIKAWSPDLAFGDFQQIQICRIVDVANGQSANAEGLFYQLIVRLHKYSLGRINYNDSIHWQRGLILDANYNGRALLRHIGNDVHITVRAAFPEYFLGVLTLEVKYLVESFWEGLRCDVTVPCLNSKPCLGLMEVQKLIESKQKGRHEYPCPVCNEWQSIDTLLLNAPAAQPDTIALIFAEFAEVKAQIESVRQQGLYNTNQIHITGNVSQSNIIIGNENKVDSPSTVLPIGQFDRLDDHIRRTLSRVDKTYTDLIQILTDEAKEGPRLFSLFPVDGNKFNPQTWVREKFRLVLWCEHSRLPLPAINGVDSKKGVYDLELDCEWFKSAVPFLKLMTGTLSLILPMMSSTLKVVDDTAFKTLENQLSLGKSVIDAIAGEGAALHEVMGKTDSTNLERNVGSRAENATLRELHALLKAKDPGFGGLVRVLNKRNEFLWVHEKFASEY